MTDKPAANSNPNLNPILPIDGVPDALLKALNDRFREIRLQPTTVSVSTSKTSGNGSGSTGPFQRTLLLKDTTVGNDIADHVVCWGTSATHKVTLVRGVLRKTISADLTVRINSTLAGVTSVIGEFTIPAATAIDTPVPFTTFGTSSLADLSVFSWDVIASDASAASAGVASFTISWTP